MLAALAGSIDRPYSHWRIVLGSILSLVPSGKRRVNVAMSTNVPSAPKMRSVAGSGLALVRAPEMSRWRSGMFVLALTVVTSSVTVGVAELINWKLELPSINPLVSPVALLLSLIGHDWQRVARGAWASVRRVFESRYGGPPQERGGYRRPPYSPPPGRGLEDDYE